MIMVNIFCNSWFRFGLPLGSAMLVVVFLQTVFCLTNWLYLGEYVLFHGSHAVFETNPDLKLSILILLVALIFTITLTILWIGTVKHGQAPLLMIWVIAFTVNTILFLTSQFVHALNNRHRINFFTEIFYYWLAHTCFNLYKIQLVLQCLITIVERNPLEPLRLGFKYMIKFYKDSENTALGVRILLTGELVLLVENAFSRDMMTFVRNSYLSNKESEGFGAIVAEEFVIRGLRCIITFVGIYMVAKGKFQHLKYWGFVYFGAILASLGNAAYLVFMWSDRHEFLNLSYYVVLITSLIYRSWSLYTCLKIMTPYVPPSIPNSVDPPASAKPQGTQPPPFSLPPAPDHLAYVTLTSEDASTSTRVNVHVLVDKSIHTSF